MTKQAGGSPSVYETFDEQVLSGGSVAFSFSVKSRSEPEDPDALDYDDHDYLDAQSDEKLRRLAAEIANRLESGAHE